MARVIGITGGFGTGKTYVASVFKGLGARVIDADRIARLAVTKGSPAYRKIRRLFGEDVLGRDARIDRKRLSRIVFGNKRALGRLNGIVHPYVIKTIRQAVREARRDEILVLDAPLLIEARLAGMADAVVVVTCGRGQQIKRCMKKFNMTRADVLRRMSSQLPMAKKIKIADFVVDNSGPRSETKKHVKKIWEEMAWR